MEHPGSTSLNAIQLIGNASNGSTNTIANVDLGQIYLESKAGSEQMLLIQDAHGIKAGPVHCAGNNLAAKDCIVITQFTAGVLRTNDITLGNIRCDDCTQSTINDNLNKLLYTQVEYPRFDWMSPKAPSTEFSVLSNELLYPIASIQGAPVSGVTNGAGLNATFAAGTGTGNAIPATVLLQGPALGTASGMTGQTLVTRKIINDTKALTSGSATTIVSVPLASLQMGGGSINYYAEATDGTNQCTTSGTVNYTMENSAGVFVAQVSLHRQPGYGLHGCEDPYDCLVGHRS